MDESQFAETERLADRMLSMAEAWIRNPLAHRSTMEEDTDFQQLDAARDTVKHQKYLILRNLDSETRWQLTRRHPVWINEYDLNILLIDKPEPSSSFPGDHIGLECVLSPRIERSLRMFFWCGGLILKVNTMLVHMERRTHAEDPTIWEVLKFREMLQKGIPISGEFAKRDAFHGGEHTWLFVGSRWEFAENVLRLDFGHHADGRHDFVQTLKRQRLEYDDFSHNELSHI